MVVGNIKNSFGIYSDTVGTEMGRIGIGETGIIVKTEKTGKLAVPFDYVKSIETEGEMNLGKIKTKILFYDVMGEKHNLLCMMSDINLAVLKKACGK